MKKEEIIKTIEKNLDLAVEVLRGLIQFSSTRGNEKEISRFLKKQIEEYADYSELVIMPESIIFDPDYSFRIDNFKYDGAANLRVRLSGVAQGRTLAFNSHLDVVPASIGQDDAFAPRVVDNKIFGRGACDCKGQIATLWLVVKSLTDLQLRPGGDITIDFVLEEECGGNGSLLVVRNGLQADAAVVLEPSNLRVMNFGRGAVWFEVEAKGKSGHSGSPESTVSAIKTAIEVMKAIEKVSEKLLTVSRKEIAKIADHPNPAPCTFGMLHSGNWPAAVPAQAILKGVFGFLPPFKREDVQRELTKAVSQFQAEIRFNMLNSDPFFTEEGHPLVQKMLEAAKEVGADSKIEFMNASADAWRYSEQLHIPTVVFGGGSIMAAHSKDEFMDLADLKKAALSLIFFIQKWSGLKHAR